jgi:ABC-type Fe3+-hydroxamate transport system substrate-binding protein
MLYTDQMNRTIVLAQVPERIVSLVPSQTELLFYLGLGDRVVGVTKFCVHPLADCKAKTMVGGTKKLDIELIKSLKPDLVIGNKEENEQVQVEALMPHMPVWMSDVNNLPTALAMIKSIGEITGTTQQATDLISDIDKGFAELKPKESTKVVYLIWRKPYMTIGNDTFIHDMLERVGLVNAFGHQNRYPEVKVKDIAAAKPNVVLLSSEPYPFGQRHVDELREVLKDTPILLVDGEMFSWYGSRMLPAITYFNHLNVYLNRQ